MDQKLLFLINREWTSAVLDYLMALMSSFDAWTPLLGVLVVVVLWRGGFRARAFVLTAALIVGFNDGVLARTLKRAADRPRPHQSVSGVRIVELAKIKPRMLALGKPIRARLSRPSGAVTGGRSFPSGHTMNSITVALVCVCFYRRWGWLAFGPALLVGYSRIYTGSHFPSDVLISIFLAAGSTFLLLVALAWLWREKGALVLPAVHARHPHLFAA